MAHTRLVALCSLPTAHCTTQISTLSCIGPASSSSQAKRQPKSASRVAERLLLPLLLLQAIPIDTSPLPMLILCYSFSSFPTPCTLFPIHQPDLSIFRAFSSHPVVFLSLVLAPHCSFESSGSKAQPTFVSRVTARSDRVDPFPQ